MVLAGSCLSFARLAAPGRIGRVFLLLRLPTRAGSLASVALRYVLGLGTRAGWHLPLALVFFGCQAEEAQVRR